MNKIVQVINRIFQIFFYFSSKFGKFALCILVFSQHFINLSQADKILHFFLQNAIHFQENI